MIADTKCVPSANWIYKYKITSYIDKIKKTNKFKTYVLEAI